MGGFLMRRIFVAFVASAFLYAIPFAQGQDSNAQDQKGAAQPAPSLGEIARQLKLKKQQNQAQQTPSTEAANQDAQASESTPRPPAIKPHLVTNDDVPESASVTGVSTQEAASGRPGSQPTTGDNQAKAKNWKSRIQAQKTTIATLEQNLKALGDSNRYAEANCRANCGLRNERQQQKQRQVESIKARLDEAQKVLDEMQESARKQGFGSSVYDP